MEIPKLLRMNEGVGKTIYALNCSLQLQHSKKEAPSANLQRVVKWTIKTWIPDPRGSTEVAAQWITLVGAMGIQKWTDLVVADHIITKEFAPKLPKYLTSFIKKQIETGASIVTGTRYVQGGGVHGWTLMCKLTSRGANVLAQTLLWPGVSDLTGSFRLVTKSTVDENIYEIAKRNLFLDAAVLENGSVVDDAGDTPEKTMGEILSAILLR